jgi:selenocysteine lyase/cysteine desulfurase
MEEQPGSAGQDHSEKRGADSHDGEEVAGRLAEEGIFVWNGNFYALEVTESLDLEPEGMVRIGLVHYNTKEEVDRLLRVLRQL